MKVMLAKSYEGQNPKGWFMSEKLDGVRAIWDGKEFCSRNGNIFAAPEWFKAAMPDCKLDGELWGGREDFQRTVGAVRSSRNVDWAAIKFMVFDIVNGDVFEDRMNQLESMPLPDHCKVVENIRCKSIRHLEKYEDSITGNGGEGVMLRKARSMYEGKRSDNLLKVKRFKTDEAEIIGHENAPGNPGFLKSLICRFNNKKFKIGTGLSDIDRQAPPPVGSIATFKYFGFTAAGLPRFASFETVRDYE